MHLFALVPFVALLLSAAFAAVAVAWNSERRATGWMAGVFLCTGAWAFVDLLIHLESDPEQAVRLLAWMHLPVLLLGTCVLKLIGQLAPACREAARPYIRLGVGYALAFAIGVPFMPYLVEAVHPTPWGGWRPEYGAMSLLTVFVGCVQPAAALRFALQERVARGRPANRIGSSIAGHGIAAAALIALTTDVMLPLLGVSFPRLGSIAGAAAAAGAWLHVLYRNDDLSLTPQSIARAVLADLHEGVAFVVRDGTILSVNERLAALSGHRASDLAGTRLTDLVDAPLDLVRTGIRDREFRLRSPDGERRPVSVSSSFEHEADGGVGWIIVVFRDLRGIDALRRRLVTSGRLAAIGELAAGIAHEVNNPAAFIRSDLNFLRRRLQEIHESLRKSDPLRNHEIFEEGLSRLDEAVEGIERIVEVVGDVRGFAHLGGEDGVESPPSAIIEGAVRLARLERREEVGLHVAPLDGLQPVMGGQDLKQVLLALIRIMTISSRVGGAVEIRLEDQEEALCISLVSDDLLQRAESQIHRFEMAREDVLAASTTALGLAIAIELIDELGGSLQVEAQSEFALSIDLFWPRRLETGA